MHFHKIPFTDIGLQSCSSSFWIIILISCHFRHLSFVFVLIQKTCPRRTDFLSVVANVKMVIFMNDTNYLWLLIEQLHGTTTTVQKASSPIFNCSNALRCRPFKHWSKAIILIFFQNSKCITNFDYNECSLYFIHK